MICLSGGAGYLQSTLFWCVLAWLQSFRLPLVQESCFVLLLWLLAAHLIPPLQTCSFQSHLRTREAITKAGCEKRSSLLGFLRPAEVRATSRSLPPQSCWAALLPLEHMIWHMFLWELGPTATWNLYCALCIYLFIYLCSLYFSVGGLRPLPRCAAAQIFALGNRGGSSSVRGIRG